MDFIKTALPGVFIIELTPINDERGFFARSFCKQEFTDRGLQGEFVQCNISFNHKKGTLRGLHYQRAPYEEVKIVSCRQGAIFDVIVDIRESSATFGQWLSVELSEDNKKSLYIPAGFAHGFQTLSDNAEIYYLMGNYYHRETASGIRYDDPTLNITWPIDEITISDKDKQLPVLHV